MGAGTGPYRVAVSVAGLAGPRPPTQTVSTTLPPTVRSSADAWLTRRAWTGGTSMLPWNVALPSRSSGAPARTIDCTLTAGSPTRRVPTGSRAVALAEIVNSAGVIDRSHS